MKTISTTLVLLAVFVVVAQLRGAGPATLPANVELALRKLPDPKALRNNQDIHAIILALKDAPPQCDASIVDALSSALTSSSEQVRSNAMEVISGLSSRMLPVAPALKKLINNPAFQRDRALATMALGRIRASDSESIALMAKLLDDKDENHRCIGLWSLGSVGPAAADFLPEVIARLDDAEPSVRSIAISSLGEMGSTATPAVPVLISRLRSSADPRERAHIIHTLGRIGSTEHGVIDVILEQYPEAPEELRTQIVLALGRIGPPAASSVRLVRDAGKDPKLNSAAAFALVRMGFPDEGLPLLEQVATSTSATAEDIRLIAELGKPAVGVLVAVVEQNGKATYWSIESLGNIGPDARDAIAPLKRFIEGGRTSKNRSRYDAAVKAIAKIEGSESNEKN